MIMFKKVTHPASAEFITLTVVDDSMYNNCPEYEVCADMEGAKVTSGTHFEVSKRSAEILLADATAMRDAAIQSINEANVRRSAGAVETMDGAHLLPVLADIWPTMTVYHTIALLAQGPDTAVGPFEWLQLTTLADDTTAKFMEQYE